MQVLWLRMQEVVGDQIYKLRFNGVGSAFEAPIVAYGAVLELPTYLHQQIKALWKIHQFNCVPFCSSEKLRDVQKCKLTAMKLIGLEKKNIRCQRGRCRVITLCAGGF